VRAVRRPLRLRVDSFSMVLRLWGDALGSSSPHARTQRGAIAAAQRTDGCSSPLMSTTTHGTPDLPLDCFIVTNANAIATNS